MRKALALLLILVIGIPVLVLSLSKSTPQAIGSVIRARLNADIISSDPGMKRDANTDAVLLHVVEGLVAAREDGSVGPMLAKSWSVSPDGRVYRFALRHGIRFHNGAPFRAADVVWSFNRYLAPDSQWRCKPDLSPGGLAPVRSVKAIDPYTVEITLDHPAPLFLTTLIRIDCGEAGIVQRASVGPDGAWRYPIGTGPFRWGSWHHNQYVELLRYAGYKSLPGPPDGNGGGKKALADRVRFSVIPDGSAASAALLRGSLDVLDALAPNELGNIEGAPGIKLASANSLDFYSILLRTEDPVLADPRLRRAIALSLDVAALTRVATHGTATPDSSPVPAASPYYGPVERQLIQRNLAEARALAKASGYRGQPIELITDHSPPEVYDDAILIQAMARDAGINIRIVTLDWASALARYSNGTYQAIVFGFSARLDPALSFDVLIGDKKAEPRKTWDSPVAKALLRQSIATADPAERQKLFDALDRQFRRDTPAIILYNTKRVTALRDDVTGFRSWPAQTQRLWNVSVGALMIGYIIKRLLLAIPTLLIVALIVFFLVRLIPGDPAQVMLGEGASPAAIASLHAELGLDKPVPVQFVTWLGHALRGDLGVSSITGQPVGALILSRFQLTAIVVLISVAFATLIAITFGMIAAWKRDSRIDLAVMGAASLVLAVPSFWLGLVLLLLFGVTLHWLPVVGYVPFSEDALGAILFLILPIVTLTISESGVLTRMMRSSAIDVLRLDYVTHARAKGLSERTVLARHVFPNAFAPTLTLVGLTLGRLFGGIAVIETVFTLPGLGRLMVDSVLSRDYPVVQGCLLFTAVLYVLVNLLVDLLYPLFDPRVTLS